MSPPRAVPGNAVRPNETCLDGCADNQPGATQLIDSTGAIRPVPRIEPRRAMEITRRRTDNQPGAVRTSFGVAKLAAVPSGRPIGRKFVDGRADNQPGAARTIDPMSALGPVPGAEARCPKKAVSGCRTDNQPGAVRTSDCSDTPACCPEPTDVSEIVLPHPPHDHPRPTAVPRGASRIVVG